MACGQFAAKYRHPPVRFVKRDYVSPPNMNLRPAPLEQGDSGDVSETRFACGVAFGALAVVPLSVTCST